MTPSESEVLAARALDAINNSYTPNQQVRAFNNANIDRVASDLAGLRLLQSSGEDVHPEARRCLGDLFIEGLRRTAALYGVTS